MIEKDIRVNVKLTPAQHRLLIDIAVLEHRNLNDEIEFLLEKRSKELLLQDEIKFSQEK